MARAHSDFSWRSSRGVFWGATILAPPLGLIVLWLSPRPGVVRKLAGSVALIVLTLAYLYFLLGMRLQTAGTGVPSIVVFETREDRFRAVDEHRAQQRAAALREPAPDVTPGAPVAQTPLSMDGPAPEGSPVPSETPDVAEPCAAASDCWTNYRGPHRAGEYLGAIRTDWGEGLQPMWRQPAGGGYASFSIAQGRAFTIEQRHEKEVAAAYDVWTGRELWTNSWPEYFREAMGGDGPRATPTWSDGFVYALGATGELRKLDASDGSVLWRKNILDDAGAANLTWGMAASPLVADGMVIVNPGGRGASFVAYDVESGESIWRSLDDGAAYTAPMMATLAGQRQLLVVSARRLMGLRVENGALLWDYPWTTSYDVNAAQPIVVDASRVFLSAGYGHGAALVEVTRRGDDFEARPVWENIHMKNKFTSSVLHEGYLYGLDEAILACVDARTGERMWKGGRYGYGQVLLASGHLIVLGEQGELALVRATPEKLDERARFSAIEGKTWNHPALAGGILLVRNLREMAAFDLRPR